MINKEDFIFTIGYQGDTAIVDGSAKGEYKNYSAKQLAENGLFKSAICHALYNEDEKELENVFFVYNSKTDNKISSTFELKKIFGITEIPEDISKVSII